jgi:ribosomal protein S12 methylthiotransferase accessory factor
MSVSDAKLIIDGDFRPPIKRGDLLDVAPGSIVAIIDGVFEQDLSVSPSEIQDAINRGLVIFGGSSMGALRAAEVPGIKGVGKVYEWYRDEIITRDDEVALLFHPELSVALTVPTVNVRFAVERLCSMGTIDISLGKQLISAATELHFKERTYPNIFKRAGISNRSDCDNLRAMLTTHDIKSRDAQAVLEAVDSYIHSKASFDKVNILARTHAKGATTVTDGRTPNNSKTEVLIWESGDCANYDEIYQFLAFTGKLQNHIREVLLRLKLGRHNFDEIDCSVTDNDAQTLFTKVVAQWGWVSSEEAKISLVDLGLSQHSLGEQCGLEMLVQTLIQKVMHNAEPVILQALKAELFINNISLKREVMRMVSLYSFADKATVAVSDDELKQARKILCKANKKVYFSSVSESWKQMGFSNSQKISEVYPESFVEQLAKARQVGFRLAQSMKGLNHRVSIADDDSLSLFSLGPRLKATGESRFCLPISTAHKNAKKIASFIGITRIGMIAELGEFDNVHIAQAARPGNAWSSSYGSGKSLSIEGATIGSIMEEVEKWAQEQFNPQKTTIVGSYKELSHQGEFLDPSTLDLPYDSVYKETMVLKWYPCFDLMAGKEIYLPLDPLQINQNKHDIYYTERGARKHLATNGLGSGFSREEAVLHGICEFVERHAERLAELFLSNPGGLGNHQYRFVDLNTTSQNVRNLANGLSQNADEVRVLDITSDVKIPTFMATIIREHQKADGFATHPDPNTAIEMALLEAAQTIASSIAGGREDLSIKARSLGRHERPRPVSESDVWFWLDPDALLKPLNDISGFVSNDVYQDIRWCLERISSAGIERVVAVDIATPEIKPAEVVRIIIPGLETNNPFFTGMRARLVLLRDLLPKWQ